jgi:hypothetical protein
VFFNNASPITVAPSAPMQLSVFDESNDKNEDNLKYHSNSIPVKWCSLVMFHQARLLLCHQCNYLFDGKQQQKINII